MKLASVIGSHTCINTCMALVLLLICVSGWTTLFESYCDKTFVERAKTDTSIYIGTELSMSVAFAI